MICFARWDIQFYYAEEQYNKNPNMKYEICFKKKGTTKSALAFYMFDNDDYGQPYYGGIADLDKYWKDSPSSSTMCKETDLYWYKSNPFRFKSAAKYSGADWPQAAHRKFFYTHYDDGTVYDHWGFTVESGTICHNYRTVSGNKYSMVMVYYGGSDEAHENKADVGITGNFKIKMLNDARCSEKGVY